ncbi:MAG: helix-turn-helix transcriptional regulator [Cyclobacteriaceae bacterium]
MYTPYSIIALLAAVQGVFMAVILFVHPRLRGIETRITAALILVFSLWVGEFAAYWSPLLRQIPHLIFSTNDLPFLFGPLIYFYYFTTKKKKFKPWEVVLHITPFLVITLESIPYLLSAPEFKLQLLEKLIYTSDPPFSLRFYAIEIGKVLHFGCYYFLVVRDFLKQKLNFKNKNWVMVLLAGFGLYLLFDLSHIISLILFKYQYIFAVGAFTLYSSAAIIYTWGYWVIGNANQLNSRARYSKSSVSTDESKEIEKSLFKLLEEEKVFLNPRLKLSDVATTLGVSTHKLSQVINVRMATTFSDLINQYRIEAFKQAITDKHNQNLTLEAIAYNAGFNSKATFNSVFKKTTGQTPLQYQKAASDQEAQLV